jgi:hypothetical protein
VGYSKLTNKSADSSQASLLELTGELGCSKDDTFLTQGIVDINPIPFAAP